MITLRCSHHLPRSIIAHNGRQSLCIILGIQHIACIVIICVLAASLWIDDHVADFAVEMRVQGQVVEDEVADTADTQSTIKGINAVNGNTSTGIMFNLLYFSFCFLIFYWIFNSI